MHRIVIFDTVCILTLVVMAVSHGGPDESDVRKAAKHSVTRMPLSSIGTKRLGIARQRKVLMSQPLKLSQAIIFPVLSACKYPLHYLKLENKVQMLAGYVQIAAWPCARVGQFDYGEETV
jgi:hypothetical protein